MQSRVNSASKGFLAHADCDELLPGWPASTAPCRVFITHGEEEAAQQALRDALKQARGWPSAIPEYGDASSFDWKIVRGKRKRLFL